MTLNNTNPFQIIEPIFSSQSAISTYQECPRRYLFNYRYYGTGIVPNHTSVPLATGSCIHVGIEHIARLHQATNGESVDIDGAVHMAQEEYRGIVQKYAFSQITDEHQQNVYQEQLALIEALIRVWYLIEYPVLVKFYKILAIEQEIQIPFDFHLSPRTSVRLGFQVRPDLIFQDKDNGNIINYSLKTTKNYDDRTAQSLTSQLQVSTEPYGTNVWLAQIKQAAYDALEALSVLPSTPVNKKIAERFSQWLTLPDRSSATRFCYLIKGAWKEENKGKGDWYTDSSLIYGWRKFTPTGIEYAPSFWTNNPENKSGFGRLGKGWEKFKVWENSDIREDMHIDGVKGWIQYLFENHIDVLQKYIVSEPEIYVQSELMESRIRQVQTLERMAFAGVKDLAEMRPEHSEEIKWATDELFPMNTQSCLFPSYCDYLPICPNGNRQYRKHVADDPLNPEFGMYRRRESHHKPEQQVFELAQVPMTIEKEIMEDAETEDTGSNRPYSG